MRVTAAMAANMVNALRMSDFPFWRGPEGRSMDSRRQPHPALAVREASDSKIGGLFARLADLLCSDWRPVGGGWVLGGIGGANHALDAVDWVRSRLEVSPHQQLAHQSH